MPVRKPTARWRDKPVAGLPLHPAIARSLAEARLTTFGELVDWIRAAGNWMRAHGTPYDGGPRGMLWAHWWWIHNRGPVPDGKRVLHLDGDRMNDDPTNLTLGDPADACFGVPRSQLARWFSPVQGAK